MQNKKPKLFITNKLGLFYFFLTIFFSFQSKKKIQSQTKINKIVKITQPHGRVVG